MTPRQRRFLRRVGLGIAVLVVTLAGVIGGVLVGAHTTQDVGPFAARFSISPTTSGGTDVRIPPLGALQLDTHQGPAHLTVRLDALDQRRTLDLANHPQGIVQASQDAVSDVQRGVVRLLFQASGAGILGALALSALVFRNTRRVAACGGLSVLVLATTGALAMGTFRPSSVEEPRYTGLLVNAPALIGDARRIAQQYGQYRQQLQDLVNNVSKLYDTFSTLPVYQPTPDSTRVLHISDLHLNVASWSVISTVVKQYDINAVIDTGDINDWGTTMESSFVDSIGALKVPYVFIRGNHDSSVTAAAVARQPGAVVLENQVATVAGLTISGAGDPRFTPDKTSEGDAHDAQTLDASGKTLAATMKQGQHPVDIALVHDPASAGPLNGAVPLVLAGHRHARAVSTMPTVPSQPKTMLMVEGSTGGAGLRGLEHEQATPLDMSVLYFDPRHVLQAYDEITVGGTGQAEVTIERHVVHPDGAATPSPSTTPPSTSPGP